MNDRLTLGALELRKLPDSLEKIAAVGGVSQSYVSRWRSGSRKPAPEVQKKLAASYPQLDPILWTQYPGVRGLEPPADQELAGTSAGELLDAISVPDIEADNPVAFGRRLLEYGRVAEQDLRRKFETTDPTVLKDLQTLSDLPIKLGKLLGHTLTTREILDAAAFRELTDRVFEAIEALPNAGDVAEAIRAALAPEGQQT